MNPLRLSYMLVLFALSLGFPQSNTKVTIPFESIKAHYLESDFQYVIDICEPLILKPTRELSREEKIICYKYLSVIYAGNPKTRARAESYMYQLLQIAPAVELVDMYVSDTVELLFKKIKSEIIANETYKNNYDEFGNPLNTRQKPAEPAIQEKKSRSWIYWTLGGLAVGGGVATYLLLSEEPPSDNRIVLEEIVIE